MNHLDPLAARALLDDTERETRGAVQPRTHLLFAVWGAAWLVGYLAMWLSTVEQNPYQGPAPWAFAILGAGLLAAAVMTAVVIGRTSVGISGPSSRTGTFYGTRHPPHKRVGCMSEPDPGQAVDLDPAIHAPARLRIVAALNALPFEDVISFPRLQSQLGLTAGNLTTHLRRLDESGYVTSSQTGRGRGSQTKVSLTDNGRHALRTYRRALHEILGEDHSAD